jgi:hypothetical protein
MRIKDAVLIEKRVNEVYEVDVEGKKIIAVYEYDLDNEASSGWDFDLSPCYVDLDEEEIEDLEEEFYDVLYTAQKGGNHDL